MIEPHFQQPTDLKLMVIDHPGFQPQFTILEAARVVIAQWQFTFEIIGESHAVSVEQDGILKLQEILVCTDLLPECNLHYHTFTSQTDHAFRAGGYGVNVCFTGMPSTEPFMMEYVFPDIEGQMPVTRIGWHQSQGMMSWWTLHTYPHKHGCTYVETHSYFDYANRE